MAAVAAAMLAGAAIGVQAAQPPEVVEGARRTPATPDPAEARSQVARGDAAFHGREVKQDYKAARAAYEKAVAHGDTEAMRKLGDMHAKGLGGKKDKKKALELWIRADKAGDPLAATLVADLYYEEITGERTPAPGQFKFLGEVPVGRVDDAIAWYQAARENDPRPEVRERADMAVYVLKTIRTASIQTKPK